MISRISPAGGLIGPSLIRFERAADEMVQAANQDDVAAGPSDMIGAVTDMMSARFAFSASLVAARTSNEMIADALDLGGYDDGY